MSSENIKSHVIFIEKIIALVYIVMVLPSVIFFDRPVWLGVMLGGALGLVNFDLFIRISVKVFADPENPKWSYFAFAWIKFGLLIAIIFFTVRSGLYNPAALLLGLSDFVVGIVIGGIIVALRLSKEMPTEKEQPAPDFEDHWTEWTSSKSRKKKIGDLW